VKSGAEDLAASVKLNEIQFRAAKPETPSYLKW
jgi:hypothetical protein